jgi:hypothetical protein
LIFSVGAYADFISVFRLRSVTDRLTRTYSSKFYAELPLVIIEFRVALTGFKPTAPTVKAYVDDQSFNPSTAAGSLAG